MVLMRNAMDEGEKRSKPSERSWTPRFPLLLGMCVLMSAFHMISGSMAGGEETDHHSCRLTILFDNVPFRNDLTTGWGFSCLVEGFEKVLLFDTGLNGEILLSNMKRLGIDPRKIETVFLSHAHGDHTGGLEGFLRVNHRVMIYFPTSFPLNLQQWIENHGASAKSMRGTEQLFKGVHSTGEMGDTIKEQGLVVETGEGLVLITGCAHPGIAQMAAKLKGFKSPIRLIVGGFHLQGASETRITQAAHRLKELGVIGVAPSHCTGEAARSIFQQLWKERFTESGVGATIQLR